MRGKNSCFLSHVKASGPTPLHWPVSPSFLRVLIGQCQAFEFYPASTLRNCIHGVVASSGELPQGPVACLRISLCCRESFGFSREWGTINHSAVIYRDALYSTHMSHIHTCTASANAALWLRRIRKLSSLLSLSFHRERGRLNAEDSWWKLGTRGGVWSLDDDKSSCQQIKAVIQ